MITIKGLRQGLLIQFSSDNETWLTMLRELEGKFVANKSFFAGGRMAFDVGSLALSPEDVRRATSLLSGYSVELIAVLTNNDATRANALAAGIPDALPAMTAKQKEAAAAGDESIEEVATNCVLVKGKLRAGQSVKHPGTVVVIGDVNPGAEVLAGGDIIVWGKLQGIAHAGAIGDLKAVICALEMTPTLARIGDVTVRNHRGKLEIGRVDQQQIVFSSWEKS